MARRGYERMRRIQLAARLRTAVLAGVPLLLFGAASDLLYLRDGIAARMASYGLLVAVEILALLALRRRAARRHVLAVVLGMMAAVSGAMIYLVSLSSAEMSLLAAPVGALLMAAPLLFPWGPVPQAGLAAFVVATFGAVAAGRGQAATRDEGYGLAMALSSTLVLSVFVAALLERHRLTAFRESRRVRTLAIQRRRLINIGRELRNTLDLAELQPRLAAHALRLVSADGAAIVRRDAEGVDYRMVATAGDTRMEAMVDVQLPAEFSRDFIRAFGQREVHVYPGGPLDGLMAWANALGVRRGMVAAVGPLPAPLAFLSWERHSDEAFTEAERLAAQAMADQAYTALCAAQLYGRALEASRLKSQFVSTVSHEFRTPLSVIMGYAEMARDLELTAEERETSLRGIEASARELLLLVEHTLDIARFEAGRSPVQLEPIRLSTYWAAIQEMCALLPRPAPGVCLAWTDKPHDVTIRSDRRRIGIIVRNLVGNALKFTERGSVTVSASHTGDQLRICVSDTGIGIRPEDQGAIFEIFRQADGSETRRFSGTGLGLFIVRQFAEQLGGSIAVESLYGSGSTFSVTLPAPRDDLPEEVRQHRMIAAARVADGREVVRPPALVPGSRLRQ